MSIRLIVLRGFGNGTIFGAIRDIVPRGYIGQAPTAIDPFTQIFMPEKVTQTFRAENTTHIFGPENVTATVEPD